MNIDKAKLKLGIWYEDENGNVINQKEDLTGIIPEKARTYHSCFPLQITEHVYVTHSKAQKETCKHKRKYWRWKSRCHNGNGKQWRLYITGSPCCFFYGL